MTDRSTDPKRLSWPRRRERLLRAEAVQREIDDELGLHLELRVEELRARGLSDEAARREALHLFGDLQATRRYCRRQDLAKERRMRRRLLIGDLVLDARLSLRSLLRSPLTTFTIVATVSLGIGATTAMFAAVRAALLRPLPYEQPAELVRIYTDAPPNKFRFSVADYLALEKEQTQLRAIAGYTSGAAAWSDGTHAERVQGKQVTWTYFSLVGIEPALGRDFSEADGRPGAPPTVIVSHGFWERRLGGRTDVIGRPIRLDGIEHTLAGVLPREVGPLEQYPEYYTVAQWDTPPRKGPFFIIAIGRLPGGIDGPHAAAAADELRAINRRMFPIWRSSYQDEKATWGLMDLEEYVTGETGTTAGLALAAVGLVWLIACANASNLLVARVASRSRELAVRSALGAARGRVAGHLLVESALLASASAGAGVVIAWAGVRLLREQGSAFLPRTAEVVLDGPVLWVLAALTAASLLIFGLAPALHGTSAPVEESLRSTTRSTTGGVAVRRLRRALVGAQFAIATPLLVVAGLLLASLDRLGRVDLGFDSENLLSGSLALPENPYAEPSRAAGFWEELQTRVRAIPGVSMVAFADGRPPVDVGNWNNFELEELPTPAGESPPVTPWVRVTPEYFQLLGLTLLEGRLLDARDGSAPELVSVVVDRAWASRFFPDESAIGKRFREGGCTECPWTEVVGVVSNVKYAGVDAADEGSVYWPMAGRDAPAEAQADPRSRFRYLLLRTSTDASSVLPAVLGAVRELDPTLPFSDAASMDELVTRSLQQPRSLSRLVAMFAAVALLLSVVGIYGVMAHYAQQHTKDISIRLALGGSARRVLGLVVGQGMRVVGIGVAAGLAIALVLARWTSSLLFGVGATDVTTYVAVGAVLVGVAMLACLVPARRAIAAAPATVLRTE